MAVEQTRADLDDIAVALFCRLVQITHRVGTIHKNNLIHISIQDGCQNFLRDFHGKFPLIMYILPDRIDKNKGINARNMPIYALFLLKY